jgi:carboxylesterase type B
MAPNGETNLAVNDVINALKVLRAGIPKIGGSLSKITIAGQSSGATMVRALLAVPSASSLFKSAIIQSDPMVIFSRALPVFIDSSLPFIQDYGFLSPGTQKTMQNFFNEQFPCNPSDDSCASSLSVSDILEASYTLFSQAMSLDPAAGQGEPIRPVCDGKLIAHTLTTSSPFPQVSKPILVTTVADEAGPAIYGFYTSPVSEQNFLQDVYSTFGHPRGDAVLASQLYTVQAPGGIPDARPSLEKISTDYLWKCPSWTFSRTWASKGGHAYVGVYALGATYPANGGIPFCTGNGSVCHQDDIPIVVSLGLGPKFCPDSMTQSPQFGTASDPDTQQTQLIQEMQARYKAFLNTGNPNGSGLAQWNTATSSSTNAILLGGSGLAPIDACTQSFWGSDVHYDYQVYNL